MKPFHYQYARHLSRQASKGIGELVTHLASMTNEANLLNSDSFSRARALTDGLTPILAKNRRESLKVENAKKAHVMSREALKAKTTDTADSGESCESSTHSPAQADSDDDGDGDGDGDGDPDPERRRPGRPRNTRNSTFPAAAENFDRLPDSACIDIATLKAITGKSRATLYRWIDRGILPKPRKLGLTHNVWAAGDIRRALSA